MADNSPAPAHEPDDGLVAARVEAAWRDLVAAMELQYPAATWPDDRLRESREQLLEDALNQGKLGTGSELAGSPDDASRHYQAAAELRAEAIAMGVVLAERGDESMHYDVYETTDALERVVRGEGPAHRIVTSRGEDGRENRPGPGTTKKPTTVYTQSGNKRPDTHTPIALPTSPNRRPPRWSSRNRPAMSRMTRTLPWRRRCIPSHSRRRRTIPASAITIMPGTAPTSICFDAAASHFSRSLDRH